MSERININNHIAVGNGENCPYCIGDSVFVNSEDNDIMEHIMNEHPSELNKLVSSPPPKPWLGQLFQLLMAKLYAKLRVLNDDERVTHETFEDAMHAMYADMKEYFDNESE